MASQIKKRKITQNKSKKSFFFTLREIVTFYTFTLNFTIIPTVQKKKYENNNAYKYNGY